MFNRLKLTKHGMIMYPHGQPRDHHAIKLASGGAVAFEHFIGEALEKMREAESEARSREEMKFLRERKWPGIIAAAWGEIEEMAGKLPSREELQEEEAKLLDPDQLLRYTSTRNEVDREQEAQSRQALLEMREEGGEEALERALGRAAKSGELVTLRAARNAAPILELWPEDLEGELMETLHESTQPDAHADLRAKRAAVSTTEHNLARAAETLQEISGDPSIGADTTPIPLSSTAA